MSTILSKGAANQKRLGNTALEIDIINLIKLMKKFNPTTLAKVLQNTTRFKWNGIVKNNRIYGLPFHSCCSFLVQHQWIN